MRYINQMVLPLLTCALTASGVGAEEKDVQAFLKKHPEADADKDGVLTPSEVWYFRSVMKGKKRDEEVKDAEAWMRARAAPAPINESKTYGPAPGKKVKLFILSGQSNMGGQGLSAELPEEMKRIDERLLMFEEGKWQPLRPLRHTFGPEIAFGHAIAKTSPDETIGIVKQAKGGTGVLAWHPNWTKEKADLTGDGHKGNLWKALTDKVRQARESGDCEVMGFIWQQGGKDMKKLETGKQYLSNLEALVEALRKETGAPEMPFVLGSYRGQGVPDDLSDVDPADRDVPGRPGALYVLKAQFDAQKELPPTKMVPLRDLERHPENVHYNTKGQLDLGRLLAEGYLEPVGAPKQPLMKR